MTLNNGTTTSPGPTAGAARAPGYAGTLAAACCAVFVAQVANALPASLLGLFQEDLHTHGSQLTWITAAFMIAVVCFEFTFGVLGDLFGRRRLVAAGTALVAAGSTVAALAPTVQVLWIGAALNGLGAGAMFPGSLTAITAVTRSMRERAHAVALWSGFLSAGAAVSPLLGGMFAKIGSWRGSFGVLVGLALVSMVLTLMLATESKAPEGRKFDVAGQITFAVGLILVLYGAVEGPESGWTTLPVLLAFAFGACFLAGFVVVELGAESPIFDLKLFRNRAFTVSSVVAVIGMLAFLGACFSMSMWMGPVQHPVQHALPDPGPARDPGQRSVQTVHRVDLPGGGDQGGPVAGGGLRPPVRGPPLVRRGVLGHPDRVTGGPSGTRRSVRAAAAAAPRLYLTPSAATARAWRRVASNSASVAVRSPSAGAPRQAWCSTAARRAALNIAARIVTRRSPAGSPARSARARANAGSASS